MKTLRRDFLKKSAALGAGLSVLSKTTSIQASDSKKESMNETLKTIHSLRTIHGNFTGQPIPDEQIDQIVHAGLRAANSSAMQTYSIIVIKDRDKMRQVSQYQGSCMLVFCVDYNRLHDMADHLQHTYESDNIVSFVTASMNTMLAAQTAVIAAKSMGIDSLLTNGVHRGDMNRHWKLLNLPNKYCLPLIALVLGYADAEPAYQKGRLDGPGIVHQESYHRLTEEELDTVVARYDDKKEHLGLIDNWENEGHTHYLDWLFKSWLGRGGEVKPTTKETQMFKILKRIGFVDLQRS